MSKSLASRWLKDPWVFLAVGFGSGLTPRMPGTVGSLLAVLLAWTLFCYVELAVQIACTVGLVAISWLVIHQVQRKHEVGDDSSIVIDEFAGVWIAVVALPEKPWVWLVAFLLFRLFDIWKPMPIGLIDRKVKGALGVLLDDVVAGLMALVLAYASWIWITNIGVS